MCFSVRNSCFYVFPGSFVYVYLVDDIRVSWCFPVRNMRILGFPVRDRRLLPFSSREPWARVQYGLMQGPLWAEFIIWAQAHKGPGPGRRRAGS